ncbi:cyclase family protein [Wukongibacter baidiensis]
MKIYDVSMEISEDMIVYKNKQEKKPKLTVAKDYSASDSYESIIAMGMHTGTHIDAPLHMLEGGETIDSIALENLIRSCKVLDLTYVVDKITKEVLEEREILKGDFILFKTKNSFAKEFDFQFIYLEKSGAEYLKDIGVTGVGIDALGIERDQPSHETHKILLGHGIIIIEGLKLNKVEEGEYTLYAPPLKIRNVEAAPARVILID